MITRQKVMAGLDEKISVANENPVGHVDPPKCELWNADGWLMPLTIRRCSLLSSFPHHHVYGSRIILVSLLC